MDPMLDKFILPFRESLFLYMNPFLFEERHDENKGITGYEFMRSLKVVVRRSVAAQDDVEPYQILFRARIGSNATISLGEYSVPEWLRTLEGRERRRRANVIECKHGNRPAAKRGSPENQYLPKTAMTPVKVSKHLRCRCLS